jgi:alpha-beta hydrolase superfamily lysophospholipase
MPFGRFNDAFAPAETDFDWLSRDRAEVAKYIDDPLCGFVLRVGGICDLARRAAPDLRTRGRSRASRTDCRCS